MNSNRHWTWKQNQFYTHGVPTYALKSQTAYYSLGVHSLTSDLVGDHLIVAYAGDERHAADGGDGGGGLGAFTDDDPRASVRPGRPWAARPRELPDDANDGVGLEQRGVRPPEAVEPPAHGHVRRQRGAAVAAVLAGLLGHGLGAQAAHQAAREAAAHRGDVRRRALLRHAAALALRVLHLRRRARRGGVAWVAAAAAAAAGVVGAEHQLQFLVVVIARDAAAELVARRDPLLPPVLAATAAEAADDRRQQRRHGCRHGRWFSIGCHGLIDWLL